MKISNTSITLGVNFGIDYNLTEVYRNNSNPAILPPVEWFNTWGIKYLRSFPDKEPTKMLRVLNSIHPVIYVRSRYLWLLYLQHCMGDLDSAIDAELRVVQNDKHSH